MKWNDIQAHWHAYKGDAKQIWPRLHDAELEGVGGERSKRIDKVRDAHHLSQEEAEKRVDTWAENLEASKGTGGTRVGLYPTF